MEGRQMRILIGCLCRLAVPSGEISVYRGGSARTGGRLASRTRV